MLNILSFDWYQRETIKKTLSNSNKRNKQYLYLSLTLLEDWHTNKHTKNVAFLPTSIFFSQSFSHHWAYKQTPFFLPFTNSKPTKKDTKCSKAPSYSFIFLSSLSSSIVDVLLIHSKKVQKVFYWKWLGGNGK